jgi:hypothetical protein
MNYQTHYNKLIQKAQARTLGGYCEVHHIVPKCMGGSNDLSNLVKLTPEEHYVAHQLLVKLFPNKPGLVRAAIGMTASKNVKGYVRNKLYGWLKRRNSKMISAVLKNNKNRLGINHTTEDKLKISRSLKGRKKPQSMVDKLKQRVSGKGNPMYGIPRTELQKSKQSKLMSGIQNSKADKRIHVFKKENELFIGTRYDFYTEKKLNKDSVTNIVSGKRKSTEGWKYFGLYEMTQANATTAELLATQQKLLR